jgi:FeS assembly SUF system protein
MKDLRDQIIEKLRDVYDPEISVNIYDLGLIYNINIDAQKHVMIRMTLTSVGCPVGPLIEKMVKFSVSKIEEINHVEVEIVFDPPWSNEHMSEEARLELGMY